MIDESEVWGMNTMSRVEELVVDRGLTLFKLAILCDVPYSTLKNTRARGGQLAVDTIEQICHGLGITMAEFFTEGAGKTGS
ncbi:MAG: helix-turn-helix transcriptional regulator [Oscillospiraceae bacterium]|nr:helix-turn-helix transcriptional regulator [Oscillospiraceae bacterium]